MNIFKKIGIISLILLVLFLILFYIFTPFWKTKLGFRTFVKNPFVVYYINKYLINYDLGSGGGGPIGGKHSTIPLIKIISGADSKTFKLVDCSGEVAKDKNNVYLISRKKKNGYDLNELTIRKDINVEKFKLKDSVCSKYFEDGEKTFWYGGGYMGNGEKKLFECTNDYDKNYFKQTETNINNNSYFYGKDNRNVFYVKINFKNNDASLKEICVIKIEEADYASFTACGEYAKDKNYIYSHNSVVSPSNEYYNLALMGFDECLEKSMKIK